MYVCMLTPIKTHKKHTHPNLPFPVPIMHVSKTPLNEQPLLHLRSLDDATVGLLAKRAYDVAGCASGFQGKPLKVFLNGARLSMASFQDVRASFGPRVGVGVSVWVGVREKGEGGRERVYMMSPPDCLWQMSVVGAWLHSPPTDTRKTHIPINST